VRSYIPEKKQKGRGMGGKQAEQQAVYANGGGAVSMARVYAGRELVEAASRTATNGECGVPSARQENIWKRQLIHWARSI